MKTLKANDKQHISKLNQIFLYVFVNLADDVNVHNGTTLYISDLDITIQSST